MRRFQTLLVPGVACLLAGGLAWLAVPRLVMGSSSAQVLYQETWRSGMKGWSGADGSWRASGGTLAYRGGHFSTLLAPYNLRSRNFAIETRIRLVRYLSPGITSPNSFGILFRAGAPSSRHAALGLGGGVFETGSPGRTETYSVAIVTTPNDPSLLPGMANNEDFDPGKKWHAYRIEVRGSSISLFIDGQDAVDFTDKRFASAAQVGLFNSTTQVQVSRFTVSSL